MDAGYYNGVEVRYSKTRKYRIEIHATAESHGKKYLSAIVMEKIRTYWEPKISGVSMTEAELDKYYTETV